MSHHAQFAAIRAHMKVIGSDGEPVGIVDKVEDGRITLTRDSGGGAHHYIEAEVIEGVSGDTVRLATPAQEARRDAGAEGTAGGLAGMLAAEAGASGGEQGLSNERAKKPG